MMPISAWPDRSRFCTSLPWRSLRAVEDSRFAMPRMPFIGVRISWLIVARNSDFAWLAASAWRRASISSRSARFRSVMSRMMPVNSTSSMPRTSVTVRSMVNSLPSLRTATSSRPMPIILASRVVR